MGRGVGGRIERRRVRHHFITMSLVRVDNLTRVVTQAPPHTIKIELRYALFGPAVRGNAIDIYRFALVKYNILSDYTLHIGRFKYCLHNNCYFPAPPASDCLGYNVFEYVNLSINDGTLINDFFSEIKSGVQRPSIYKHARPYLDFFWQNNRLENTMCISYEISNNDTCMLKLPLELVDIFCKEILPRAIECDNNNILPENNDLPPAPPG